MRPRAGPVAGRAWQVEEAAWEAGLREGESLGQTRIGVAGDCSQEEARSGLTWSVLWMRIPVKVGGGQRTEARPQPPLRAGLG